MVKGRGRDFPLLNFNSSVLICVNWLKAKRQPFHALGQPILNANKKKSKADQTVIGICIILSNNWKGTVFIHQGVTNCGFWKLVRYNLRERACNMIWHRCSEN